MRAENFTRYGCDVGDKFHTYDTLTREWVCNQCGGRIVEKFNIEAEWVECGRCGAQDFIHETQAARERAEAREVLRGLPDELAEQLT